MAGRHDVNGAGTTSRILDVAERLLQVRGYNGFSYGDVADRTGHHPGRLHYHFPGKGELGQALIERYATRFGAALADLDATAPDAAAKLRGYVAPLHRRAQRRPDVPVRHARRRAPHAARPAAAGGAATSSPPTPTWLRKVLEEGCADGSLRCPGTSEDSASMVLGALEGAHADRPARRRRRPLHRDREPAAVRPDAGVRSGLTRPHKRICRASPVGAARQIGVSTRRAPEGIRTPNLLIRSQMLYPLSYGCLCSVVVRGGSGI